VPGAEELAFFIREPFPGSGSQVSLCEGALGSDDYLTVWSEMEVGGTIFGDGIETDALSFDWGRRVDVHVAAERLHLVSG
jgi:hypothetical protein